MKRIFALTMSIALLNVAVSAADIDLKDTYLDPATAPIDYKIQGEYEGTAGPEAIKFGVQVIALGDGKFHLISYAGGLPSADRSHKDVKVEIDGELEGDAAVFTNDLFKIEIANGELAVSTVADGILRGTLYKVQRESDTLGAKPPAGAVVLFDGSSADAFEGGKLQGDLLAANCFSREKFGDHTLHLEFRTPFKPKARGQARGNSGVYMQSRYELQVLDSFGLAGKNNECGGIYSIAEPNVNMCFPPLQWQTYDIDFTAARYDDEGNKTKNARATIRHNGVVIHDDLELPHGTPGRHPEGPEPDAIYLQGHGNPVVYRNIWVVKK